MTTQWKKSWRAFRSSPPGERFVRRYEARKGSGSPASRIALVAAGLVLVVGGAILLVIPGPGLLVIAFGGALIGQEFLWIAKGLDRLEVELRRLYRAGRRFWKKASTAVRAAVVTAGALCAAGAAFLAYAWLLAK